MKYLIILVLFLYSSNAIADTNSAERGIKKNYDTADKISHVIQKVSTPKAKSTGDDDTQSMGIQNRIADYTLGLTIATILLFVATLILAINGFFQNKNILRQ